MQKIIRIPLLVLVVVLSGLFVSAGCGGSSSTATDDGAGVGDDGTVVGGGEGGSVPDDSDPLRQFSLSNVSLDPESLLVTNSTRTLVPREETTGDDYSYEDWSMVGYAQEMIQDEVSWNANKINAELKLFDWGLNQEILSGMPEAAGEYVYAHIIWPAIVEADVESATTAAGEFIDVFNGGVIERYYRYSRAEDDTWRVEICNADETQFLQYDRLVDVTNRTIDTSAIYSESFVLDTYEMGGEDAAGGSAAAGPAASVSAGENQVVWSFLTRIDDNRVLIDGAEGEVDFGDISTASQTAYFQDSYMNGMAEITLNNTDVTDPYNTVRGYYDSSFSEGSSWSNALTAVNGLGTTYPYEGTGVVTFAGTEPAMDMSWFCSDLTATYVCANWDADWEAMATDCADFWMTYDGTCTGQEALVMECFALIDNGASTTCELDEEYSEDYYMEDDAYGYPEFYLSDGVSNTGLSDTLAGLSNLTESDVVTVEISRTWDCAATAWNVDEDMSDETLPDDVANAFAQAWGMLDHADPSEAQSDAATAGVEDQCTDCGYVEDECYDATCYCEEYPDDPFCDEGGAAYCELYPDDPSCSDGGYDYCDLYPDDPYCTEEGGDVYCEEACADFTDDEYDLCVVCCGDPTLPECTY